MMAPPVEVAPPEPLPLAEAPLHITFPPEDHDALLFLPQSSFAKLLHKGEMTEILGPSCTSLLRAQIVASPMDTAGRYEASYGRWLEVSLMPNARFPQVLVGPLNDVGPIRVRRRKALGYQDYGILEQGSDSWRLVRAGGLCGMTLRFTYPTRFKDKLSLEATGPKGELMASACIAESLLQWGPCLKVLAEPNVDMLLCIVCIITQALAVWKVELPAEAE